MKHAFYGRCIRREQAWMPPKKKGHVLGESREATSLEGVLCGQKMCVGALDDERGSCAKRERDVEGRECNDRSALRAA